MAKKKIEVQGLSIRIEPIEESDYVSLTDIAKKNSKREPNSVVISWLRNQSTISFLFEWEKEFNPNFKHSQMAMFRNDIADNRSLINAKNYIERTGALGMISKAGRYGGTYAHKDIALHFASWLNPAFHVAMIRAFRVLLDNEINRRQLKFDIQKITENIDEIRNILDGIDGQDPKMDRRKGIDKAK